MDFEKVFKVIINKFEKQNIQYAIIGDVKRYLFHILFDIQFKNNLL